MLKRKKQKKKRNSARRKGNYPTTSRRDKKTQPPGAPSLDSIFSSGHGTAFTSGMSGVVPGGESTRKKKKLPIPRPWPQGEETLIIKNGEIYEV